MNQLEFGGVFYHCGATQQARAKFTIQIQGKGGHGSSPHEANDAIVIAGHLVIALQTIVSRRISPMESGVVTIGFFDGKGEFNSIKDRVILEGDVRCMAESTRKKIEEEIKRIAFGTARTYGCDITVQYQNDYPVLWNDPSLTKRVVREWKKAGIAPVTDCGPLNPSEDFSYYSQQVPSCFFYIGAQPAGKAYPHHHPKFDIREEEIKRIAFGTARTYGCDITVQYQNDYPVLWNDPSLTKRVVREWKKAGIAPVTDCGPLNPSEDFSYYSQQVPSCFFYIGAQPAGKAYPHHHPKFDIREEAMMKAARAMTVATLTCLAEKEMK